MLYRLWLTSTNATQTNFHFHSLSAIVSTEIKTAWLIFMTKAQKSCVLLSAPTTTTQHLASNASSHTIYFWSIQCSDVFLYIWEVFLFKWESLLKEQYFKTAACNKNTLQFFAGQGKLEGKMLKNIRCLLQHLQNRTCKTLYFRLETGQMMKW